MRKLLLVDGKASWVRSLFSAMKGQAEVYALMVRTTLKPALAQTWRLQEDGLWNKVLTVPGRTKFPVASNFLMRRAIQKAIRKFSADGVVYTLPVCANVARAFEGRVTQAYYAFDPYRFYDEEARPVEALERRMVGACDVTFAISQALAEDFRKISDRPVIYSPNAASSRFLAQYASGGAVAGELNSLQRPIVGCVGQINSSYDWTLVSALADALREATFVFVGPILEEPVEMQKPMRAALGRPNVKWLGPIAHARLPEFLRGFDVCFNPLAISEQNDRRSPLRLYDYLCTDRPVVSTGIREAFVHEGLVETFSSAAEGLTVLRRALADPSRVDMAARTRYIRLNTWESRAMHFLEQIDSLSSSRGSR